ncbi:hypothetical protein A2U01_0079059, partial [Trifolium medium]|nr:hypothetical protein [Trifolium medium]
MNPDQGNNDPGAGRGRRKPLARPLRHRVVRSRYLEGMPKSRTVDGVEVNYDSYDDADDLEDEQIDESLLLAPEHELLVDRHDRAII